MSKKKEQQDLIIEAMTTGEGRDAMSKAITEAVLCTPYSLPTILLTGRGSAVAPTNEEVKMSISITGLTKTATYNKLMQERIDNVKLSDFLSKFGFVLSPCDAEDMGDFYRVSDNGESKLLFVICCNDGDFEIEDSIGNESFNYSVGLNGTIIQCNDRKSLTGFLTNH